MKWFTPLLTLLSALVQLALAIVRFLQDRELRRETREEVGRELDALSKALSDAAVAARRGVSDDPDSVLHDPYNRDTAELQGVDPKDGEAEH
jgi:hypothetical protein